MSWEAFLACTAVVVVGTATVVRLAGHLRTSKTFLLRVRARLGDEDYGRLRARHSPEYLAFSVLPELSFRTERADTSLHRYPTLRSYRSEPSEAVLRQYLQELRAHERFLDVQFTVCPLLLGAALGAALPKTVSFLVEVFTTDGGEPGSSHWWLNLLARMTLPALVLCVFVLAPMLTVAWVKRQVRLVEIHSREISRVLEERSREASRAHALNNPRERWKLIQRARRRLFSS